MKKNKIKDLMPDDDQPFLAYLIDETELIVMLRDGDVIDNWSEDYVGDVNDILYWVDLDDLKGVIE